MSLICVVKRDSEDESALYLRGLALQESYSIRLAVNDFSTLISHDPSEYVYAQVRRSCILLTFLREGTAFCCNQSFPRLCKT